ncbi:hypothetical protein ACPCUK_27580 [Streptomyces arboris]|uniref:hypothetical protein n=1 Tax=Streptomyces arboris TaxID=2600619 RepID=UPI003C2AFDDA
MFPDTPLDVRTELQIGGVWTDITADVYTREPITITRGAADESSALEASTCELQLNNRAGKYSPRNPISPYYGLIGRNTPLRVSVPGPESYLQLDGSVSSYARTPDTGVLDITGDIDLRVEATCDWHTGSQALVGKWGSVANQRSYLLRITDGLLYLNWSVAGSVTASAWTSLPALPRRAALRATLDVDNGSGGYTASLYWATSMTGPWNLIAAPVGGAVTSIFNSNVPLEVAPIAATGVSPVRGIVHRAEVRSGIGGAVVASLDARALTPGTTSWTDSAGRTWTLGAAAAISDRAWRFHGEISSWPARWDVSGQDVWVPVEAAGTTRRLGQGRKALESTLRRRIPSASPLLAYWPMEENQSTGTQAYSPVSGVRPLTLSGADWASDDSLGGSAPLPSAKAPTTLSARVPSAATTGWQVEWVYNCPTLPAVQTEVLRIGVSGAAMRWVILYASTSAIRLETQDSDGTVIGAFSMTDASALAAFAGKWNRLAIYTGNYGGGATLVQATWRDVITNTWFYAGTAPTTGQGRVNEVAATWGAALEGLAVGHLAVFPTPGTGVVGSPPATSIFDRADDGFLGETALARITRLAVEEAATVDLTGRGEDFYDPSTRLGPQRPGTLLELLEEIQEADGGILYERRDRTGLVYRDRTSLYSQPVALALDYTATGEVPPPLEPVEDDQRIRNDVTVTRSGGSSARAVLASGPLSVQSPPAGVGPYDEALTLSLYTDDQPEPIANWRMHVGTWDEARYPTVTVWLHAAPHLIDDALGLDIGDRLTIANPPAWLPPGDIDQHVLGYTEVLDQYEWTLAMNCVPAGPWAVGVVGDAARGHVDTDGSRLSAAASASDTVLQVEATTGPTWVEAPAPLNTNSTFRDGLAGWFPSGSTIERVPTPRPNPATDQWALQVTPDGVAQYPNAGSAQVPVTAGQSYTLSGWLRCTTSRNVALNMNWYGPGYLSTSANDQFIVADTWTQFSLTATAPVGATAVNLAPTVPNYPPTTDVLWASHLTLRPAGGNGSDFPFDIRVGGEVVTVQGVGAKVGVSQPFTVIRSVNGISKAHPSGADVRLAHPAIVAL